MKKGHLNLIVIMVLVLLFFGMTRFRLMRPESTLYVISQPIYRVFDHLGERVSFFFDRFSDKNTIRIERNSLLVEKQNLLRELAEKNELLVERDSLLEALNISDRIKDWQVSVGRVTYFNQSQDWLLVNLGEGDGILPGQPIVNSRYVLIGFIEEVYRNQSLARLISSPESLVKVKTVSLPRGVGLLRGEGGLKVVLDSSNLDQPFRVGDNIVTDFFKDSYPAGLLIGQITRLERDDVRSLLQAEVNPFFSTSRLDVVFAVKDF